MPVGDWRPFKSPIAYKNTAKDCQQQDKPPARKQNLRLFEGKRGEDMGRWNGGLSALKASQIREFYPWQHILLNDTELSPTWNPSLSSDGTPWAWHSLACLAPANHGNVMGGCSSSKPTPGRGGKPNSFPTNTFFKKKKTEWKQSWNAVWTIKWVTPNTLWS